MDLQLPPDPPRPPQNPPKPLENPWKTFPKFPRPSYKSLWDRYMWLVLLAFLLALPWAPWNSLKPLKGFLKGFYILKGPQKAF